MNVKVSVFFLFLLCCLLSEAQKESEITQKVFMIPNFHPASCGWLADFSTERNYCANSYFAHLDRVDEDSNYNFVISEVNNMIAMLNFQPERFEELKMRIKEGRVEAVNGMFLELSPNLSGGEAVVRMGVNGIRWQEQILGVRPRFNWLIDVTGMNEQMAQIGKGLGLEAQVYCRNNISGNLVHWAESPDGSKLLTVSGGHYMDHYWRLTDKKGYLLPDSVILRKAELIKKRVIINDQKEPVEVPQWSPYLILQGKTDYNLPPENKNYTSDLIGKWEELFPKSDLRFTTFGDYFDHIRLKAYATKTEIPVVKGGWPYRYIGFWVNNDVVKSRYRKTEHLLQTTEMLATISSLNEIMDYPARELYHAWLQLHLNTDRNTIWGAAGGMVFQSQKSWDVNDRFNWINTAANSINSKILGAEGSEYLNWFNPVNWERKDPQIVDIPRGKTLEGVQVQKVGEQILFIQHMQSTAMGSVKLSDKEPEKSKNIGLPETIKNKYYEITIDRNTGEIKNITSAKTGKTILAGGGNVIIAEQHPEKKYLYHEIPERENRVETASTRNKPANISVIKGSVATIVEITKNLFGKNDVKQIVKIYENYPRIDFDLYLEDIPDKTVVSAEFPLKPEIKQIRRGIPYGFAAGSWPESTGSLCSNVRGINPAIRWSDYDFGNNTGFAVLDRGVTGREHVGNNPRLLLMASADSYFSYESNWLSGKGKHHFQYAIVGYDSYEMQKNIPRLAWEYNNPPIYGISNSNRSEEPFFTSSDNIILHSCQRINDELELRFAESQGKRGLAEFNINLSGTKARITNFLGEGNESIRKESVFSVPVNPQQIITLRFKTKDSVQKIVPLTDWTPLVPMSKRAYLNKYDKSYVGHPPR